jgi:hypothetical protein
VEQGHQLVGDELVDEGRVALVLMLQQNLPRKVERGAMERVGGVRARAQPSQGEERGERRGERGEWR